MFSGKVEMGRSKPYIFVYVFYTFWPISRYFGQNWPRARKPLNPLLPVRPHLHENIGKSSPKMIKKRQSGTGFESATMTIGGAQKGPINV